MSVKVSVVIPVYNPGRYIEPCVESLLRQSMSPDEYEIIFVDDGSTDETPAYLDQLAAEQPNVRAIHIPNSGWPGKPRNVGVDAAAGEYVQFLDHDDSLGLEALQRLYDFGVANAADVVVGKMVGKGRAVPRELFRVNRPQASIASAPLIDSLTPHKMFRRGFLDEIGLRFPEGRRRLEDHVFVTEALLRARNVAVLSDYVCYVHTKRADSANAGLQLFDPVGYFANLREALDVVERFTEPSPLRDRLYRRWFRNEMIERLRGRRMLAWPTDFQTQLFHEIHDVATERFGPGVAAGLPTMQQVVAALIMADRLDDALALAKWETRVSIAARLDEVRWSNGSLRIAYEAELRLDGEPLALRSDGGASMLELPLSDEGLAAVATHGVDLEVRPSRAKADLVIRERETSTEFFLPSAVGREVVDSVVRMLRTAAIDPSRAAGGRPLPDGVWDLLVRVAAFGWTLETKLGGIRSDTTPAVLDGAFLGDQPRFVVPYWTDGPGNLAIDVGQQTNRLGVLLRAEPLDSAALTGSLLTVRLPLHVPAPAGVRVRFQDLTSKSAQSVDATLDTEGVLTVGVELPLPEGSVTGVEITPAEQPPRFVQLDLTLKAMSGSLTAVVARRSKVPLATTAGTPPARGVMHKWGHARPILRAIRRRARKVRRQLDHRATD